MSWNKPSEEKTDAAKRGEHGNVRLLLGVACIALGATGVWWLLPEGTTRQDTAATKPLLIKEAKPAIDGSKVRTAEPNVIEKTTVSDPAKIRVKTFSVVTNNAFNRIVERYQTADGKTHKRIRPARPPVFSHATDDFLAMAVGQSDGGAIPPIPLSGNLDRQFLKSIEEPIIIEATDSDEIKKIKCAVRDARIEVKHLMDEGLHFSDILAEHEKFFNENAEIRAKAIAEARKVCDEGDTEGTSQYVETMNAAFESMGIEKIDMPKTKEERLADIAARRSSIEAAKAERENKK